MKWDIILNPDCGSTIKKYELMEHLFDGAYIQGYTAALQDVLKVIEEIQVDLKVHKRRQSYKTYKGIIQCMLNNRTILRENPDAFVRCNDNAEGGYEVYIEGNCNSN